MKNSKIIIILISMIVILIFFVFLLLNKIDDLSYEKNLLFNNLLAEIKIGMERNKVEEIIGKPDDLVFLEQGKEKYEKYSYFVEKIPKKIKKIIICRYYWGVLKKSENAFIYNNSADEKKLLYFDDLINLLD